MTNEVRQLVQCGSVSFVVWGAIYAVRRWLPGVWLRLENAIPDGTSIPASRFIQATPALALGAALNAFLSGEVSPRTAFIGVFLGGVAPVAHHFWKAMPVPYRGAVAQLAKTALRRSGVAAALLAVACLGPRPLSVEQTERRRDCLELADEVRDLEADRLCPPDEVEWDKCDARARIEHDLSADYRACSRAARQ